MLRVVESKALHLWALWTLAVTRPLFDLLGHTPEFFVARQLSTTGILLLVGTLLIILPGILVLIVDLFGRLAGAGALDRVYLCLFSLLAALLTA